MSISGAKLAEGSPARGRVSEDFYATDPETVRLFIQRFHEDGESLNAWSGCKIIEPCCGDGNIVKALKEFGEYGEEGKIIASDIADRGCEGGRIRDFFTFIRDEFAHNKITCIITNPPFGEMNSFLSHALYLLPLYGRLVIFSKIQTLEGQGRGREGGYCVFQLRSGRAGHARIRCGAERAFAGRVYSAQDFCVIFQRY